MSAPLDLVLKSARAVVRNPKNNQWVEEEIDIGIRGGKIAELASQITTATQETLNLNGLKVLPGVIDSQVHMREPGMTHKEDLETGSRGALLGGITSVFEMPNTTPPTTNAAAFQQKLDLARNRMHTNYAFYIGATPENALELQTLEKAEHCCAVKIFMGSSTGTLLVEEDVHLEKILRNGKRRVAVHAEDEARLRERKQLAIDGGHPKFHPIWRDEQTALIATKRIVNLARKTGRPVHVLHVTSAEEMDFLKDQKDAVSVECLPQHLTFAAPEVYERLGTYAQMNPPIRDERHRERLWKAVLDGTVDVIASDHAPHTREEKDKPYPQSPSGFPGVQTILPLMLHHVNAGKLPLTKLVELMCEGPCRVFGALDKGRIAMGADADFTVIDMKKSRTIHNSWIASRAGWTPFDGMTMNGWPVMAILNGQVAMRDDQILRAHSGQPVNFVRV